MSLEIKSVGWYKSKNKSQGCYKPGDIHIFHSPHFTPNNKECGMLLGSGRLFFDKARN